MNEGSEDIDELEEDDSNENNVTDVADSIVAETDTLNEPTNLESIASVPEASVANSRSTRSVRSNQQRTWTKAEIFAVDRESWSWPPNFLRTRSGQSITLAILIAARTEGYAVKLDYSYRIDWFERMFEKWYQLFGLLRRYKIAKPKDLRL